MNIAIWGLGVSGISALKYLATTEHTLYVINQGDVQTWNQLDFIQSFVSSDYCFPQDQIPVDIKFDQIILAPGIDRKLPVVKKYIDAGVEVICEVELAYRNIDLPIIAITGTNGKTSTATMMDLALRAAGQNVFLGGNIGTPFCEILLSDKNYDFAVLELSSFQLESLVHFHAQVAILLNITESHMERYYSFQDYEFAKFNITMNQTRDDLFIVPTKYLGIQSNAIKKPVQKLDYDTSRSKLVGEHHRENLYCVKAALDHFKLENSDKIIQDIVDTFNGVKYRLEYNGEWNGAQFINDGKSTNIDATISALKSFPGQEVTLILGGKLRSSDLSFLGQLKGLKIKQIFGFGEAASGIYAELNDSFEVKQFKNLDDVFREIKEHQSGGVVLFSPAFPSFDLYANYLQRGAHFEQLVQTLNS